ncbi:MAG: thiol-disulfide oxidoreductase DCC family protein [Cytophagales bacterium]|nr:MAG: thiol-disulfide oxidoreductase DCC family protein [Cytophagales bacterium]
MHQSILLFDGVCNLCNGVVQFIIRRDKKNLFLFASLQSETGQKMLRNFGLEQIDFKTFILIENDKCYYTKSSAALMVFKRLGGLYSLLYLLIIIPKFIRDFVYDIISKNRYKWFGKTDTCMIPEPSLKNKFLE